MKKTILISFFLIVASFIGVSGLGAQSQACTQICDFYSGCVETKKKLSADEKKKVTAGCLNTCRKNYSAVTACYETHSGQCTAFNSCLMDTYKSKSK
ncbi:Cys-rich protein [Leptospira wolffii]|uniref:Cys-rich protein n=1 Tax=Leptospira wolffii TaxID=409998 RepID=UPI0003464B77|nr:Cys-rich protein [Leptospira wolffii]TGK60232.1 Cys-rich protein [Leptospira wolffii]TGK72574.1 Cys-rich protein [Leptospira wolffii]TGK76239.1 Cys-rich protein [Leptospira wolffii]TGL30491.1 Cys-rich protein [Leptospira wolffii]